MTSAWANVDSETLKINYVYNDTVPMLQTDVLCSFPADVISDYAVRDELGNICLTQDPEKIKAKIESAWVQFRSTRDAFLKSSDWIWSIGDLPASILSRREEWAAYRQALRDLPANTTDPTQVQWPVPPTQ
jgi:hypothetical protein